MTFANLIQDAYEDIGWLSKGKQLDGHDTKTALRAIQRILGLWSEAGWMVVSIAKSSFTLVIGQNSYTVGASGSPDVSNARPTDIKGALVRDSGNHDYPVRVITAPEFRAIFDKTVSQRPTRLYYLPSAPNGTIYLDSNPASAETLHYDAEEPISEPSKSTETITLAPAYREALLCRLRISLATKKHQPIDPLWLEEWREAKAALTTRAAANRITVSSPEFDSSVYGAGYDVLADL